MAAEVSGSKNEGFVNDLASRLGALPYGKFSTRCLQCGLCATSCPTCEVMDYSPQRLFAVIKEGRENDVLGANTMWMCTSCYSCKVICPYGIAIADMMHDLKYLAIRTGKCESAQAQFYLSFWREVYLRGRSFETGVLFGFYRRRGRTGLKEALGRRRLGFKMLSRKRISLIPPRSVKDPEALQRIITKAKIMQNRGEV
ncbi:4Fe-4S dicluster domain-containing protein [Acididesulfobacillus acetoxydans]|nr:4Fe-4S dicluster domain-containing protein [Acididesulfobacillus acetoxydans]